MCQLPQLPVGNVNWAYHLKMKECLSERLHAHQIRSYDHCRRVMSAVMIRRRFTWHRYTNMMQTGPCGRHCDVLATVIHTATCRCTLLKWLETNVFHVLFRCQDDLNSFPLENWRRPPGRPRTMWMKTIQQNLKSNNLSLNEAIVHSGDWCLHMALHTPSGACQKWKEWVITVGTLSFVCRHNVDHVNQVAILSGKGLWGVQRWHLTYSLDIFYSVNQLLRNNITDLT